MFETKKEKEKARRCYNRLFSVMRKSGLTPVQTEFVTFMVLDDFLSETHPATSGEEGSGRFQEEGS